MPVLFTSDNLEAQPLLTLRLLLFFLLPFFFLFFLLRRLWLLLLLRGVALV